MASAPGRWTPPGGVKLGFVGAHHRTKCAPSGPLSGRPPGRGAVRSGLLRAVRLLIVRTRRVRRLDAIAAHVAVHRGVGPIGRLGEHALANLPGLNQPDPTSDDGAADCVRSSSDHGEPRGPKHVSKPFVETACHLIFPSDLEAAPTTRGLRMPCDPSRPPLPAEKGPTNRGVLTKLATWRGESPVPPNSGCVSSSRCTGYQ